MKVFVLLGESIECLHYLSVISPTFLSIGTTDEGQSGIFLFSCFLHEIVPYISHHLFQVLVVVTCLLGIALSLVP